MKQAVHSQKGRPVLRLEKLIRLVLEVIGLCRSSFFRIAEQQYPAVRFKARYLRERRIESPQPVNLRNVSYGFAKVGSCRSAELSSRLRGGIFEASGKS